MSEQRSGQNPEDSARGRRPRRILIADDLRDSADSLAMLLRMVGHDVQAVYGGEEARRAADEMRPDVILLDIGMPQVNGYEVCRYVRSEPWGEIMFLIALTGWGQEDDRRTAREVGFDHHLVKPVDPDALMKLLNRLPPKRSREDAPTA